MTQSELIANFPPAASIPDRVLLINPSLMPRLQGCSIQECRVFLLLCEGRATLRVGSETTEVRSPALVDMLVWEPVTFAGFSDNASAWCLLPNYLFTNESLNGLKPADSESFKDRHEVPSLTLEPADAARLAQMLGLLDQALADFGNHYRRELCQTFFRAFMLEAGNLMRGRRAAEETERVETRQDTILRGFLKLVWSHYKVEHNVDFYARRLCISSKHLSRVVSDRLGKTPYAVIRDEILQQAMELLKTSKKSVQEIAAELHFSETAAFCKFFKKHTGRPPTAYRGENSAV